MFQSYDNLQVEIYTSEIQSDNLNKIVKTIEIELR
jgi:hypothetical protein